MADLKLLFLLVLLPLISAKSLNRKAVMNDLVAKLSNLEQELDDVLELTDENKRVFHNDEEEEETGNGAGAGGSNAFQHIVDASGKTDKKGFHFVDMKFTKKQEAIANHQIQGDLIKETSSHWDDKFTENGNTNVKVPYTLASNLNPQARAAINLAIEEFSAKTCIRLKAKESSDTNYIAITAQDGCWSYVGKIGGRQDISIGNGCEYKSTAVHEIMHALGYFHEQSRQDRDSFIKINLNNIQSGLKSQFDKQDTDNQETTYDYDSVMHYGATAFSKNGRYTIERITGDASKKYVFGSDDGLSTIDAFSLNKIYCPDTTTATTTQVPVVVTSSTEAPGVFTTTTAPGVFTTTEAPGVFTTTEEPESTTTEAPEISTTEDPTTGCNQWPTDDKFCRLVRKGGLCQYCTYNNFCSDSCVDKNPRYCGRKVDEYYENLGLTKPSEQQKRAMRAEGKQNRKGKSKHPCDRWWFKRNCAGSCAFYYCDASGGQ